MPDGVLAAAIGFLGGILLGLAGQLGRFCTLGAIEDALYGRDYGRLRMWALALALAIAGIALAEALGAFDPATSVYADEAWNPVAGILGGLVFGYGMAIAGNCGFGALTRLGGGDIRSFLIVLVMGVSAYMAMSGPIGILRIRLFPDRPVAGEGFDLGYAHGLSGLTGAPAPLLAALIALPFAFWALASPAFRRSPGHVGWSVAVAAAIVFGWVGSAWLADRSFGATPVQSYTFSAPLGETILYLMTASGTGLSFAVGSVAGVLAGAVAGSRWRGRFRWEACDDPRELGRQILGAFLMGVGAVLAVGCSIGQGLTAFSTLQVGAPVALASIFAGAAFGLRRMIEGPR